MTAARDRYLLVSVVANEAQALGLYRLLQRSGLSPENVAIVGSGYRDCDAVGFAKPLDVSRQRAFRTAAFTGVIGAVMGLAFLAATPVRIFDNMILNILLAITTAGLSGAMGGFLVGGGVGLLSESGESISYRSKVERGKYLVLVEGAETLVEKADAVVKAFQCESTQRYYFRPPALGKK